MHVWMVETYRLGRRGWSPFFEAFDPGWYFVRWQAREACEFLRIPDEDMIRLIVSALLPWALGDRDPVAERVERQVRVHERE